MKLWLIGALVVAVATTTLPVDVQAKGRLGGGKSSGMQRNMPARTAPDAPPAKPATPTNAAPSQQAAPTAAGAAPAAAAAPKRNWMGPIAGLAAGLGLAALMSHLGMGAGFANAIMMALLAAGAIFLVMFLVRRFGGGASRSPSFAGAGTGNLSGMGSSNGGSNSWPQRVDPAPLQPAQPTERRAFDTEPAFTPVGQTPSAQPASAQPAPFAAVPSAATAAAATTAGTSADSTVTRAFVPASFDSEGFARTAKMIFIRLQTAHDLADLDDLRRFTTPELFASLRVDLQDRGPAPQQTDVVKVEAEVLDIANEGDSQIVSVRFHGQVVEEKGATPTDFNEVWHLVKPHDDSRNWAIAGIEQLT